MTGGAILDRVVLPGSSTDRPPAPAPLDAAGTRPDWSDAGVSAAVTSPDGVASRDETASGDKTASGDPVAEAPASPRAVKACAAAAIEEGRSAGEETCRRGSPPVAACSAAPAGSELPASASSTWSGATMCSGTGGVCAMGVRVGSGASGRCKGGRLGKSARSPSSAPLTGRAAAPERFPSASRALGPPAGAVVPDLLANASRALPGVTADPPAAPGAPADGATGVSTSDGGFTEVAELIGPAGAGLCGRADPAPRWPADSDAPEVAEPGCSAAGAACAEEAGAEENGASGVAESVPCARP